MSNITRWLVLGAVLVSSAAWAQEPGHYTIQLGGWDPSQFFNFTPNPADLNTNQFSNNFCPNNQVCFDPFIHLNGGGGSMPESGPFSFTSGTGNTTLDVQNTGPNIDSVLITLTDSSGHPVGLPPDQLNEIFTCSSDFFQNCGFNNDAFTIAFWNPVDPNGVGIPTATPEPSQMIFLLLACAAVVVARYRKGAISSPFARTQR